MKRIFTILASLCLGLAAYAQQQPQQPDYYELAEKETERLQRAVKLEDWQLFYVDSTLVTDYTGLAEEIGKLQANKVSNTSMYQMVQDKWMEKIDASYKKFFTEEQWAAYLKQGAAKARKQRAKRAAKLGTVK